MKQQLLFSGIELDPLNPDYDLAAWPSGYILQIMRRANELGLEGKRVTVVEVRENFASGRKYLDLIEQQK